MAHLDAPLLGEPRPLGRFSNPLRMAAGLAGTVMLGVGGWAGRHVLAPARARVMRMSGHGTSGAGWAPKVAPKEDMETLLVKPGPPLLAAAAPAASKGVSCIFSYGSQLMDETSGIFSEMTTVEDGFMYGIKIQGGGLAHVSGKKEDITRGRLFCWDIHYFTPMLSAADNDRVYDQLKPEKNEVRRATGHVVKSDGSSKMAHFYYYQPGLESDTPVGLPFRVLTWNLGSVNTNPFEFHLANPDDEYNKLMSAVEDFFQNPGARDIPVKEVFTDQFYNQLMITLGGKLAWEGTEEVSKIWETDWSKRKIISEFLMASDLETKRLISMPDRTTKTIMTLHGPSSRPAITSPYVEMEFKDMFAWWDQWKEWMFIRGLRTSITQGSSTKPYQTLRILKSPKYPLSAEERRISLPLQMLALAVYDAIHVHIMNTIAPNTWLPIKKKIVKKLVAEKATRTIDILTTTYKDYDLICLQEASASLVNALQEKLGRAYFTVAPEDMVPTRDQNSVLIMRSNRFDSSNVAEITHKVKENFQGEAPLGSGDLLAVAVRARSIRGGTPFVITSFHGDQRGQATIPVLNAVAKVQKEFYPRHRMIFGLDANAYAKDEAGFLSVSTFAKEVHALGLTTSWGDMPEPSRHTTSSARSYLQPAGSKAVKIEERMVKGDHNPKDFVLFSKDLFRLSEPDMDSTGNKVYIMNRMIPTLSFPSDHAIVSCVLSPTRIAKHPIKLIAWDLDGTLAASRSLGYVVTNIVMEKLGFPRISQRDYDLGTRFPTVGRMSFHITGTTTDPIGEKLAKAFDEATVRMIRAKETDVVMYPGAEQLLDDITGGNIPSSILSNGIGPYVDAIVEVNHVQHHFEPRLGADMVPNAKPKPDGLYMISKARGVPIDNMIYVGDSSSDAKAGRAAGMPTIGVSWGSHTNEELEAHFDVMCADFYSLREVLVSWGLPMPLKGRMTIW